MPGPDHQQTHILLVDSDEEHNTQIQEFLSGNGGPVSYRIDTADRLQAGILAALARPYDLCILSLDLPDSRGLETFFKFQKQLRGLPVIVMTDVRHEEVACEALRSTAQDYLIKGTVDARALKSTISFAIDQSRIDNAVRRHPSSAV